MDDVPDVRPDHFVGTAEHYIGTPTPGASNIVPQAGNKYLVEYEKQLKVLEVFKVIETPNANSKVMEVAILDNTQQSSSNRQLVYASSLLIIKDLTNE